MVERDPAGCRERSDMTVQIALHSGVEVAERERSEVGAAEMFAFVRSQPPRAPVRAFGHDGFLLMARHLPGLDFDYKASAIGKQSSAPTSQLKRERIAMRVDCVGYASIHRLLPWSAHKCISKTVAGGAARLEMRHPSCAQSIICRLSATIFWTI
ncbi:MAG: hypothetical protein GEU95_05745 [Rhizobiales bacterium]|nr:hypothetical protein [Hyphomicrobiales bacterium]